MAVVGVVASVIFCQTLLVLMLILYENTNLLGYVTEKVNANMSILIQFASMVVRMAFVCPVFLIALAKNAVMMDAGEIAELVKMYLTIIA